jgi:hypothetical protein
VRTRAVSIQLSPAQLKRRTPDNPFGLTPLQLKAERKRSRRPRAKTQDRFFDKPQHVVEMIDHCYACGNVLGPRDTGHVRGCRGKVRKPRASHYRMDAHEKRMAHADWAEREYQRKLRRRYGAASFKTRRTK